MDFYAMRPGVFWEAMNAHQKEIDENRIHIGELIRGATVRLINIQLAAKDRIQDPRKYWPMPWDKPEENAEADERMRLEHLSDEERRKEIENLSKRLRNGWKSELKD